MWSADRHEAFLTFSEGTRLASPRFILFSALLILEAAPAQTDPAALKTFTALSRFVPENVSFFVSIRELDELDGALRRARVWSLFPSLTGRPAPGAAFDLHAALTRFLGPASSINLRELLTTEVGIVSSSWQSLDRAVWLVRLPRPDSAERWFPVDRRIGGGAAAGRAFRMDNGLIVCVRDDVAAIGRRWDDGSCLRDVVSVMTGGSERSLDRNADFRALLGPLPARPLAVAYGSVPRGGASAVETPLGLLSSFGRVAVGVYENDGRIDFAIRAALDRPRLTRPLSTLAMQRLLHLPQTTLWTLAANIQADSSASPTAEVPAQSILRRYAALLGGILADETGEHPPAVRFGPHVIFVWGQDLSDRGTTPQLAVLIECDHGEAAVARVEQIGQRAFDLLKPVHPESSAAEPAIHESSRLGVRITHVPLKEYAESSRAPWAPLLGGLEPAWAASGPWLVVALTRDHLERILDGQHGLIPTLNMDGSLRSAWGTGERSVVSVFRGGLSGEVMRRWLKAQEEGLPSLLDPRWWTPAGDANAAALKYLGIGMRGRQEPGGVVVARLHPGSSADGRLQAGDRIVGVDGALLDLNAPNADLRRKLAESESSDIRTLRVLRGEQWLDVSLPRQRTPFRPNPQEIVRELAALADALEFAGFAVLPSTDNVYSARLSLRFAATPQP